MLSWQPTWPEPASSGRSRRLKPSWRPPYFPQSFHREASGAEGELNLAGFLSGIREARGRGEKLEELAGYQIASD